MSEQEKLEMNTELQVQDQQPENNGEETGGVLDDDNDPSANE